MPNHSSIFTMLQQLVASPSVSCTSPKLDQSNLGVIHLLANWLEPLGFTCEIIPLPGQPHKANLIAQKGEAPGGLVLSGHTDTVPYDENRWQSDPFTLVEKDDRWYGLGATDMKGFFPVAIEAIKQIGQQPLKQPIFILATADEESSMAGARLLAEMGRPKARYAIVGEPTGLQPIRMHKGMMMESVIIEGKTGHSSDPTKGNNAIDAMHEVIGLLQQFREKMAIAHHNPQFAVPYPTLNLGCIHGGDNPNRICGRCELQFDLRPTPGLDTADIQQQLRALLHPVAAKHSVSLNFSSLMNTVEAFEEKIDSPLLKAIEDIGGQIGSSVNFATEAPFLQQIGMETIVIGPGSINQAHQPDEFIAVEQIAPAITLIKGLINRLCL